MKLTYSWSFGEYLSLPLATSTHIFSLKKYYFYCIYSNVHTTFACENPYNIATVL